MRVCVAIFLVAAIAAIVSQSSAVSVGRPGDRPGVSGPPLQECRWYRGLCRFLNPCWYRKECQGYPDAVCKLDQCECRAEYYNGEEKIDCQEVTVDSEPEPDVTQVDVGSGPACEPVQCRLFCLDGYVKDSNGCDTCECIEPADRRGVCPSLGRGQGGTCAIECSSDAGCDEGSKCCSNGCGRVCVPACSGILCRINCRPFGGFARDENGCEICRCVGLHGDSRKVCPVIDAETGGICVNSCESDGECINQGEKCCSNGCGRTCLKSCDPVRCRMFCEHGYVTDENNCEICKCKTPPGCPEITCRMSCQFGFERNEEGCEVCRCFDPRPSSGPSVFSRGGAPVLPGICPATEGSGGICVSNCALDEDCNEGQKCCSNGCGMVCKAPCPGVTCRMACPSGYLTDDNGCNVCHCKPPRVKFGKCPAVTDDAGGLCVNECDSDGDCPDRSMKCCSNGCGQTCRTACSPVRCRLGCRWGFATNTEGCEICKCKPDPATKPGECPVIDPEEQGGICVQMCSDDSSCHGETKCCSNGCGNICTTACPVFRCRIGCRFGYVTDVNGCRVCECKPPPGRALGRGGNCAPLVCRRICPFGYKKNDDGCDICECNEEEVKPGICPVVPPHMGGICVESCGADGECPEDQKCCSNGCGHVCRPACSGIQCRMYCKYGFLKDENGCDRCECAGAPDCEPLLCRLGCRNGYKKDENGCDICACRNFVPPFGLGRGGGIRKVCPVVQEDVGGICAQECDYGENACSTGQICCSNGCGHSCVEGCERVKCRMHCEYGWATDESGCEICGCKAPPTDLVKPGVCPEVRADEGGICVERCGTDGECPEDQKCCSDGCGHVCKPACSGVICYMLCRYGFLKDENGCDRCACAPAPESKCPSIREDVGGICVEECDSNDQCGSGQMCCSNGCGHSCMEACPPFMCRLKCLNGYAKNDNGCEICSCAAPPVVLTCPSIREDVGGICVEECQSDDQCGSGELCCSNGCGHTCKEGCRPVLCYLYCRHGWAKGEDGCDICQCADPPTAVCPTVSGDVGGICVEECESNGQCGSGELCCSNGCGRTCKEGCKPVVCRMRCQHGWATDEQGCEICECKQQEMTCPSLPESTGGICVEECESNDQCDGGQLCCSDSCGHSCREGCLPVLCYLYCKHGWKKGENGCDICQCADAPLAPVCPPVSEDVGGICVEECDSNDQCDGSQLCCSNGCGHACREGCQPVLCRMYCQNGWATNEQGCEICKCKQPADNKIGICPDIPADEGGICVESCGTDGECPEDQKCCSNGCGHVCVPACSPVMCLIYCPFGYVKDENNCNMCDCAPAPVAKCPTVPEDVAGICVEECASNDQCGSDQLCCSNGCGRTCKKGCEPVVCRMHCQHGWATDEQGCEICECKQPDLQCPNPREGSYGLCVDSCIPDTPCGPGQKCCSNGCGHQCMTACPPLNCGLTGCRYGHATDENGCETCGCRGPPEPCRPVKCRKFCRYGYQEENGCKVCKCNKPPQDLCEPVKCRMHCTYGFAENENGCEICQCNPPPDVECRDGKIYQDCGTACPMTCENVRSDELIACPAMCVQGCFCPPGTVLDSDGMCVKQRQCGCLFDADSNGQKEYYQLGDSFEIGIRHKERCQCRRDGAVMCTRRKGGHRKQ